MKNKNLDILEKKLTYKHYSPNTIKVYLHYAELFFKLVGMPASQITVKAAEKFLLNYSYSSVAQQNQLIGAVKAVMKYVYGKKEIHLSKIERPRKIKKIPETISGEVLISKITAVKNLKHRAILILAVSGALRVSEVINLKLADIDRGLMIIRVKGAKGYKDRNVPLTPQVLLLLEKYYLAFNPSVYLFNGISGGRYSTTSCNKLVKKYISPTAHFHTLRHSAATIMHENGLDIATLSKILGHNSVKTTMIYTHISNKTVDKARVYNVFY